MTAPRSLLLLSTIESPSNIFEVLKKWPHHPFTQNIFVTSYFNQKKFGERIFQLIAGGFFNFKKQSKINPNSYCIHFYF
jgi:hypothetical protein